MATAAAALLISLIRHRLTCWNLFILCDSATITYMFAGAVTNNENRNSKPYHFTIRVAYSILCIYWTQHDQGVKQCWDTAEMTWYGEDGLWENVARWEIRSNKVNGHETLSISSSAFFQGFKYCFTPWVLCMIPYVYYVLNPDTIHHELFSVQNYLNETAECLDLSHNLATRIPAYLDALYTFWSVYIRYTYVLDGKKPLKIHKLRRAARSID